MSFLIFWLSSSLTKYCWRPWSVSLESLSIYISNGFFMYILQTSFILSDKVAENIMTYFWDELLINIFWTWDLISVSSSILSHSSRINIDKLSSFKSFFYTRARILPGVPIIMCGGFLPFKILTFSACGHPP